ncbi:uncharacterized protein GGS22DRAFT_175989 [Annulohypoxylon maeteangense]|uniref:uncharacterized protein n=1 Tax=Annulohypoxylon maeteangense TaxID=1927788 RepID=UPI0020089FD1|nr:uncharacterized protein GGS22DRAFT_175989 [Annulohypoxylon maeteangense]KAI0880038.1 hypothetical protein GGS22DRAFT_175989 [Annulohypoxylon maeteangense]
MFFTKTIAIFVAVAAPLSFAIPAEDNTEAYWAQFCDDTTCSQNCGESVSVANTGCLNEPGRKSIRFHGSSGSYSLVGSPQQNCPCQNKCSSIPSGIECWDISSYSGDSSLRFISGSCNGNNC